MGKELDKTNAAIEAIGSGLAVVGAAFGVVGAATAEVLRVSCGLLFEWLTKDPRTERLAQAIGPVQDAFAPDGMPSRERLRFLYALDFALSDIRGRVIGGETIPEVKSEVPDKGQPPSSRLLEGCLRAVVNEHDERKARCLGRLFSNWTMSAEMSSDEALEYLTYAEAATYTELTVLAVLADAGVDANLATTPTAIGLAPEGDAVAVLNALHRLCQLGAIQAGSSDATTYPFYDVPTLARQLTQNRDVHISATDGGRHLAAALGLWELRTEDAERVDTLRLLLPEVIGDFARSMP